ncbi:acetyltransferase, GNAT family [Phaeosphaeria sp. MPI-PUGE-AT-0046c]|nr:acetyltransferase, GNAT family [Phaeosphaeria sp. MPI-PUGE-AT-0046c]
MSNSEYIILQGVPTPQTYHDLRKVAGLTPPPMEAVAKALANSIVGFLAYERKHMVNDSVPGDGQEPVAMGRLSGDGSLFLLLTDVATHPDHQRRGLGQRILQALVDYIDEHAPEAYVSLVADPPGQKLYPKFGFKDCHPGLGMYRMIRGRKTMAQGNTQSEEP